MNRFSSRCAFPLPSRPAMDTRGGGCATSPYRTPQPRDSAIPGYKACRITEETILRQSAPFVSTWAASIAFSPGDGRAGRGRFPSDLGSRRGGKGRSTESDGTEPRGRLFPVVLFRSLTRWGRSHNSPRAYGPPSPVVGRQYCVKYCQATDGQIHPTARATRVLHAFERRKLK